jgi:hypothetical protein
MAAWQHGSIAAWQHGSTAAWQQPHLARGRRSGLPLPCVATRRISRPAEPAAAPHAATTLPCHPACDSHAARAQVEQQGERRRRSKTTPTSHSSSSTSMHPPSDYRVNADNPSLRSMPAAVLTIPMPCPCTCAPTCGAS